MLLVKYKWLWQLQNQNFRFKVTHSSWCYTGLYKDVKSSFVNSRDEMVKMTWSACSQGSFIARQTPSIIFVWAPSINAVHTESASSHHTQLHHLDPWCCGRDRSLWRSGTAVPLARLSSRLSSSPPSGDGGWSKRYRGQWSLQDPLLFIQNTRFLLQCWQMYFCHAVCVTTSGKMQFTNVDPCWISITTTLSGVQTHERLTGKVLLLLLCGRQRLKGTVSHCTHCKALWGDGICDFRLFTTNKIDLTTHQTGLIYR